jgi:hypothetical protein
MASPHEPAREARTARRPAGVSALGIEVAEGIFAAGLAMEDAAAVAGDPLVRRRIENAISALDDVIRLVRGASFGAGPGRPAPAGRQRDKRVRYWLGESESALDVATTALSRAGELEQDWPSKFGSDVGVLRSKLALLREAVRSH